MQDIQDQIKNYSTDIEHIFLALADKFPALLNKKGGSSLEKLQKTLDTLKADSDKTNTTEGNFFGTFDNKYKSLFDDLNKELEDLSVINSQVTTIKEDSEEMELITLNAMVISIKSGEKGRAFSTITDNLKRLSNQMYDFSDQLINEQQELLKNITQFKNIFNNMAQSQKQLAALDGENTNNINHLIHTSSDPLTLMHDHVKDIYQPIQQTMEGLQMQDIIRQATDHVLLCLNQYTDTDQSDINEDKTLDTISFNIELIKITENMLADIIEKLNESIEQFNKKWAELTELLKTIDSERNQYVVTCLTDSNPDSMKNKIEKIVENFSYIMNEFNHYHSVQKDLEYVTKGITERVHTMYAIYENLQPVINNLHHVRILQQIEVAKNDAISSVRDSVTDMDGHIVSAKNSLDSMQQSLQQFASQTDKLLGSFNTLINKDNDQMKTLKVVKSSFFNELQNTHDEISLILKDFQVLPEGFEQECKEVENDITKMTSIKNQFENIITMLQNRQTSLISQKESILEQRNLSGWEIKNDKFKDLIKHFTLTSHKEVAGKIGGFDIEKGTESGEITFF